MTKATAPASPRQELRDAVAARSLAQTELDAAQAALARVQAVVKAADDADDLAEDARYTAAEAAKRWAAAGADPETTAEREQLAVAARLAKTAAEQAQILAAGARQGLPDVHEAVRNAQMDVDAAEAAIVRAIGGILLGEIEPTLKILERSANEYRSALFEVESLWAAICSTPRFAAKDFQSAEATQVIAPILEKAKRDTRVPDGLLEHREELEPRRRYWEARARALRSDPNAE